MNRSTIRRAAITALVLTCAALGMPAPPANAFAIYVVTNVNDIGAGSLRDAIDMANGSPGLDSITFALPGAGPRVIVPQSDLPAITDPLIIAGYTEPGASPATATTPATLTVVINGTFMTTGLTIDADNSAVSGLVINSVAGAGGDCGGAGICVRGDHNLIRGNYIGTGNAGAVALQNNDSGVIVLGADNQIGGEHPADRNLISGNRLYGVELQGTGTKVLGNRIGSDATGTNALGNGSGGILVNGAGNQIGSDQAGGGNVISGNPGIGLDIDNGADFTIVHGNLIGVNATATAALANDSGIEVSSNSNEIGGFLTGTANVVSGNTGVGLEVDGIAGSNQIVGNLIGVAPGPMGPADIGNGGDGVWLRSSTVNSLGTDDAGGGNTISGNDGDGVRVDGNDQDIKGNRIGTAIGAAGTLVPLPNTGNGITVSADRTIIGGDNTGSANVIGTNRANGIELDAATDETVIRGNAIGTDPTGAITLSNTLNGILITDADTNHIGSVDPLVPPNRIAFNGLAGIALSAGAVGNDILGNLDYGNVGLGINLDLALAPPAVVPNDFQDPDAGANNLQNYPIITAATFAAAVTTINWRLNSTPLTMFRVEFFAAAACGVGGVSPAETFLGAVTVVTNANGNVVAATVPPVATPAGTVVMATATEMPAAATYASTSEIGACVVVV
ncbi:hypothetical protein ACQEVZ_59710 [Dactylosporangium sp. CA-152071]|uniref:hypothetical protein n=1 Tax=Dactylosporangium sp. CA-152071 TaxID=3239933 RepID=UPI003D8B0FD8